MCLEPSWGIAYCEKHWDQRDYIWSCNNQNHVAGLKGFYKMKNTIWDDIRDECIDIAEDKAMMHMINNGFGEVAAKFADSMSPEEMKRFWRTFIDSYTRETDRRLSKEAPF